MIVAFIGFGEAGLAIAESLGQSAVATLSLRAFDIKLADENDGMAETMSGPHVRCRGYPL